MNFSNFTIGSEGISFSPGYGEKTNYGNETVSEINSSSSVSLNKTTVTNNVNVDGSIDAFNANIMSEVNVRGCATLNSTICQIVNARGYISATNTTSKSLEAAGTITTTNTTSKSMKAGGNITLMKSKISEEVITGGSITANECEILGAVNAGGSVDLDECSSIQSVSAGNYLTLRKSNVEGNVSAENDVIIKDSTINKTLTCSSKHLIIENSQIDTIVLRRSIKKYIISSNGRNFIGSINNVMIINSGSSININKIDNNMFINGKPFSQYLSQKSTEQEKETEPKQVVELKNCTVKNIIFEGGNGELILSNGSKLTGNITGGKLKV